MRVLLIALLAAISYAQTVGEHLVGVKNQPRNGRQVVLETFPQTIMLSDNKEQITINADPSNGISESVLVTFLEPISAGSYGVVFECQANAERIAMKLLMRDSALGALKVNRGHPIMPEELIVLNYLWHKGMRSVCEPKLGGTMHAFKVLNQQFQGYAMELIQFGTLWDSIQAIIAAQIGCGLIYCFKSSWEVKKKMLLSSPFRDIYYTVLRAIMQMWSHGVIHRDLHTRNILFDQAANQIRIIDFANSRIMQETEYVIFQRGVTTDFLDFTFMFAASVMYPEHLEDRLGANFSNEEQIRLRTVASLLHPDMKTFSEGRIPTSDEFEQVFQSFRNLYDLHDYLTATPEQIRSSAGDAMTHLGIQAEVYTVSGEAGSSKDSQSLLRRRRPRSSSAGTEMVVPRDMAPQMNRPPNTPSDYRVVQLGRTNEGRTKGLLIWFFILICSSLVLKATNRFGPKESLQKALLDFEEL